MQSILARSLRLLFALAALLLTVCRLSAETQVFSLASQWNLISFQVIPTNPDPAVVFSTLPGFQTAWSYHTESGLWQRYTKPSGTQTNNDNTANRLLPLPPIEPGKAYWVFTSQSTTNWQVIGSVPTGANFRSLDLKNGWNLIGIPVGAASLTNREPVSLLAILTSAGFDYDAMLAWENQSYRKMFRPQGDTNTVPPHPLAGLPPDQPFPKFDLQKDLGRGYWVRVIDPAIVRPKLVTTARPDIDTEPTGNFPSKEDINVSGAALPKNVQNQDVIRFFPGEDVQTLGISNLGDGTNSGGGILIWEALWIPATDIGTPEPWIRLFTSPDEKEQRDQNGLLLAAHTNLTGVTTLENDIIYLRLDRKNLGRGMHEGTLLLRTSVGDKSYAVKAEVPGLEGDFKGYAVIETVNGKRNKVPDIDLSIGFYEDNKVNGLLRGLMDSSLALLWPVDVPMIGYRVADEGNQFILGGSFVLPPGDQNGEPFDTWDQSNPAAGQDVDWLNDNVLDVRNPFPFPIQRTVSLEGSLIKGNPTDGYILEGKYTEIVYGMSRQPITMIGTFHLERQAARPLSSRRSISTDTGVEPVVVRKGAIPLLIPAGTTRTNTLTVTTEMELQALQVTLSFLAPLPHSQFVVRLRSPGPGSAVLVLYDGSNSADAINTKLLESVTFPLERPTTGDLAGFLSSVTRTKTDVLAGNVWKLEIQNTGSQAVTLSSWTLRLDGQPVADITGVVRDGGTPVTGVTVSLDGVPFSMFSTVSGADGRFILSRVPLLPLNFSATRPGYLPADPLNPGLSAQFTRPFVGQSGLTFTTRELELISRFNPMAGSPPAAAGVAGFASGTINSPFELQVRAQSAGLPSIIAGPRAAFVGSTVEFFAENAAGSVRWDFGDGATGNGGATNHVYLRPGAYRVSMYSPADAISPQASMDVIALPAPGRAPARPVDLGGLPTGLPSALAGSNYTAYLLQSVLAGGGVIPAHKVGVDPGTGADRFITDIAPKTEFTSEETNEFGAAYVADLPLQHTYAASMDIDLAPHVTPADSSETFTSDGFEPLTVPGFATSINSNDRGFKEEDFNYAHVAAHWINTRVADGSAEYDQDPFNGLIVWGNNLMDPYLNYSAQTYQARDGENFSVAQDDLEFHPHRGTSTFTDLPTSQVVTHYRMACSLALPILTAPLSPAAVNPAKPRRGDPDSPFLPGLIAAPAPLSRNLVFRLHIGLMALD